MGVLTTLPRQGLVAPISLTSPAPKFYADFAHSYDVGLWTVDSGTWTHPLPTRVYRGRNSAAFYGTYLTVGSWRDLVLEAWVYPKDNIIANFYQVGLVFLRQDVNNNYFLILIYDYRAPRTTHQLQLGAVLGGTFDHWIVQHTLNFVNVPNVWYKIGLRKRGDNYTIWVTDKVNRDIWSGSDPNPLFLKGGVGLIAYACEGDFGDLLVC